MVAEAPDTRTSLPFEVGVRRQLVNVTEIGESGPLTGVDVVLVGESRAAAFLHRLLAEQGASVRRIATSGLAELDSAADVLITEQDPRGGVGGRRGRAAALAECGRDPLLVGGAARRFAVRLGQPRRSGAGRSTRDAPQVWAAGSARAAASRELLRCADGRLSTSPRLCCAAVGPTSRSRCSRRHSPR